MFKSPFTKIKFRKTQFATNQNKPFYYDYQLSKARRKFGDEFSRRSATENIGKYFINRSENIGSIKLMWTCGCLIKITNLILTNKT